MTMPQEAVGEGRQAGGKRWEAGSARALRTALFAVRHLGLADYVSTWRAMQRFTAERTPETSDELWVLEHPPTYTYGVAGRSEHLPKPAGAIPVIKVDRGGQITYHGPGQLIVYTLLDLRRRPYGARELVRRLEEAVIACLGGMGVSAERRCGAPGVYVGDAKIAALGLRVSRGCSYHGLSLNVDCDLDPFAAIDPCGYPGLQMTSARQQGIVNSVAEIADTLVDLVIAHIGKPS